MAASRVRLPGHYTILTYSILFVINNYTVVRALDVAELITKVNALISMGWQPQGSVAVDPISHLYLQAMWTTMK